MEADGARGSGGRTLPETGSWQGGTRIAIGHPTNLGDRIPDWILHRSRRSLDASSLKLRVPPKSQDDRRTEQATQKP